MFNSRVVLLVVLGLLVSSQCEADNLPLLHAGGGFVTGTSGGGGGGYQGPGDVLSGATVWASCQFAYSAAVAAAATQKTCNLRRASDSHTCDVIIATSGSWGNTANCSNGGDNGTTAAVFCNATTCSVTTAYDQSGSLACSGSTACDLSQATAAKQPTVVFSAVGSNAALAFTAASAQFLMNSGSPTLNQPLVFSEIGKYTNNSTQATIIGDQFGTQLLYDLSGSTPNQVMVFCGLLTAVATAADGSYHNIQGYANTTASALNVDGSDTAGLSCGTQTFSGAIGWGAVTGAGNNFMNGNGGEAGLWAASSSATVRNNLCHNQTVRWGIAAC